MPPKSAPIVALHVQYLIGCVLQVTKKSHIVEHSPGNVCFAQPSLHTPDTELSR